MSNFKGMDPEAIRQVATNLQQQATSLEGVLSAIEGQIQEAQSNWRGQDSDAFEQEWSGSHKATLQEAITQIQTMSTKANDQAAEQESTSQA
jgi:WXG100 family type VII secretion target